MEKKKGFTLVELLIVIVILAVLASLVLPRMLAQPERAIVAEAVNYLGVIRRAQEAVVGPTGTTGGQWIAATSSNRGAALERGWGGLGLSQLPYGTNFRYTCTAGAYGSTSAVLNGPGTCSAFRVGGTKNGSSITMNLNTGLIMACGGAYKLVGKSGQMGTTCA